MKILDNVGILLLSIMLITWSTLSLFTLRVANLERLLALVTLLTGVMLLFRLTDSKAYVNVGMLLLCVWLMLSGGLPAMGIYVPNLGIALAVIAIAGGVFFLPTIFAEKSFYNLGLFLLGVWLVLNNGYVVWGFQFPAVNVALGLLGSLAGLLLLLGI